MGFTLQIGKKTDDDDKTAEEKLLGITSTLTDLLQDGKDDEKILKTELSEVVQMLLEKELEIRSLRRVIDRGEQHHVSLHAMMDSLNNQLVEQEMRHRDQQTEDERIIAQLREALKENGIVDPTVEEPALATA